LFVLIFISVELQMGEPSYLSVYAFGGEELLVLIERGQHPENPYPQLPLYSVRVVGIGGGGARGGVGGCGGLHSPAERE
jgi:hypothetical protein